MNEECQGPTARGQGPAHWPVVACNGDEASPSKSRAEWAEGEEVRHV